MSTIPNFSEFINEGVDFDLNLRKVSYNPKHQRNVDTSVEHNPIINDGIVDGIEVWSIFQRKKGFVGIDGNPLIRALKGEDNWSFKSEKDRLNILHQFDLIADKFVDMFPESSLTIVIPSENKLNEFIASEITKKLKDVEMIDDCLRKLTIEEVSDIVINDDTCEFRKHYKNHFNAAYKKLDNYFRRMKKEKNGKFTRHYVKDSEMRDVLDRTLALNDDFESEYASKIYGKNVLIIDDSISRGQTIKEACEIIKDSYAPKTIRVLTLMSSLKS